MRAIEAGPENPYLVAVVVMAVVVVGGTTMTRIPADLLPQFSTSGTFGVQRDALN